MQQNVAFTLQARDALERLTDDIEEVRAIRAQTQDLKSRLADSDASRELVEAAGLVGKRCNELESRMHNPEAEVVYDVLNGRDGGAKLYSQISPLFSDMQSSDQAPTQGQLEQMQENLADLKQVEEQLQRLRTEDLARLEAQAKALGVPRVIVPKRS
jgi:DNA repair exonuclease SbcCD ATPase subunit